MSGISISTKRTSGWQVPISSAASRGWEQEAILDRKGNLSASVSTLRRSSSSSSTIRYFKVSCIWKGYFSHFETRLLFQTGIVKMRQLYYIKKLGKTMDLFLQLRCG